MENENQTLSPELTDILNRINAFNAVNPDAMFLFAFLGFKKDEEGEKCDDCGEVHSCVDDTKFLFGGHGDLDTLRQMNNDLRDQIEDNSDKRGFVSF